MIGKEKWVTSREIAEFIGGHRDNDIRVNIAGINVPIIDVFYDRTADMITIQLDTDSEDYRIAMTTDGL